MENYYYRFPSSPSPCLIYYLINLHLRPRSRYYRLHSPKEAPQVQVTCPRSHTSKVLKRDLSPDLPITLLGLHHAVFFSITHSFSFAFACKAMTQSSPVCFFHLQAHNWSREIGHLCHKEGAAITWKWPCFSRVCVALVQALSLLQSKYDNHRVNEQ